VEEARKAACWRPDGAAWQQESEAQDTTRGIHRPRSMAAVVSNLADRICPWVLLGIQEKGAAYLCFLKPAWSQILKL
jgi:hypothetical protein